MEMKRFLNVLYPAAAVLFPFGAVLILVSMHRFDWPDLKLICLAGLLAGIIAEVLMFRNQREFEIPWKKLGITIACSAIFWFLGAILPDILPLNWGWGFSAGGRLYKYAVLFLPAAVTSVYWLISAKKPADKAILFLTNPVLTAAACWHAVDALLSCLPT